MNNTILFKSLQKKRNEKKTETANGFQMNLAFKMCCQFTSSHRGVFNCNEIHTNNQHDCNSNESPISARTETKSRDVEWNRCRLVFKFHTSDSFLMEHECNSWHETEIAIEREPYFKAMQTDLNALALNLIL